MLYALALCEVGVFGVRFTKIPRVSRLRFTKVNPQIFTMMIPQQSMRRLTTSVCRCKKVPTNLKGKGSSSTHWMTRQLNDPYVEKAKMMNYRCRSAFKLLEIESKFNFLSPGSVVVDCGASPGSWTQVAVDKVNSNGTKEDAREGVVIAVDKQPIYPIDVSFH